MLSQNNPSKYLTVPNLKIALVTYSEAAAGGIL